MLVELSGVVAGTPVISAYTPTPGCNSCTGNSLTTSAANSMILTFIFRAAASTAAGLSPFAFDTNANNGVNVYNGQGHLLVVAGGYTPTWSSTGSPTFYNVSIGLHP